MWTERLLLLLSGSQGILFPWSVGLCVTGDPLVCPAVLRKERMKIVNHLSILCKQMEDFTFWFNSSIKMMIRDMILSVCLVYFTAVFTITPSPIGWTPLKVTYWCADIVDNTRFHLTAVINKYGQHIKLNMLTFPLNLQSHGNTAKLPFKLAYCLHHWGRERLTAKENCWMS